MNLAYRLTRVVLRTAIHAYYDMTVVRAERVPESAPTIFASNHPNSLLDPIVIGACLGRQLHFVAKSTLFVGLWGKFMRMAGAIPVYRRQDNVDMDQNVQTFQSCWEVLEGGGAIGIFPEGLSHTDPQLKELKTGVARIALDAQAKNDWKLPLSIVPVGLSFQNPPRFRSRVTVRFGKPLTVEDLRGSYERDPREAVQEATHRLEERIAKLIVNIERLELAEAVRDVERIYLSEIVGEAPDPDARLEATQEIARAVHLFMSRDPDRATRLARRIRRYLTLLAKLGLRDDFVKRRLTEVKITRESARLLFLGSLLLPLAAYGLLVNYLPIRAAYWAGRLLAPQGSVIATARFAAGLVAVLLTYPIELYLAWRGLGLKGAIAFGISLPISGYFAVLYPRLFASYLDRLRSAFMRKTRRRFVAKLRTRRAALIAELSALRQEYLRLRDEPRTEALPSPPG